MSGIDLDRMEKMRKAPPQEAVKRSDWGACGANGCPLEASVNAGSRLCSYHAAEDPQNWPAVTEAIKKSAKLINWRSRLVRMSGQELHENFGKLVGHKTLPYDPEKDTYSGYMIELSRFISKKIKNDASKIIANNNY